jgi:tetratricopeptide (TPR) repeat protein
MILARHWTGREAAALRQARRMSIRAYATHLGVAVATVTSWEARGAHARLRSETQQLLDIDLARAGDEVHLRFAAALADRPDPILAPPTTHDDPLTPVAAGAPGGDAPIPDLRQVEQVREGLADLLAEDAATRTSLDDWDHAVLRHGRATRDQPGEALLRDLGTDLAALKGTMRQHHTASALRRLTRAAAQLSGLMCLTLCRLDQPHAAHRWARTGVLAAERAGDPDTACWVLAQEAYGYFYAENLADAIGAARHAQAVVSARSTVGAALAAALEARAHAVLGQADDAHTALDRAQHHLSHLPDEAVLPSAFGYTEAQLRFHESNAYTHLGDHESALAAQERALRLCTPHDYTDWAMIRLDRAHCLARNSGAPTALDYAARTLTALTEAQRRGIITLRGHHLLDSLPPRERALPTARDLRDLLMLTTRTKEVPGP